MMKLIGLVLLTVTAMSAKAWAGDGPDDFMGYYSERVEGITVGAGNAKEVNSATHIIDPWPPYAADRRIPGDGERMSRTIRRYKDVTKIREAAPALAPEGIATSGFGSASGSAGSGR